MNRQRFSGNHGIHPRKLDFDKLDERVRPYAVSSNLERIDRVIASDDRGAVDTSANCTDLSIICLSKDAPELLQSLIPSLSRISSHFKNAGLRISIHLVDTGTTDLRAMDLLARAPVEIRVHWSRSYHFSRSNNEAAKNLNARYLLFLNNDVLFCGSESDVLKHFEVIDSDKSIGILGSRLLFPDGTVQHDGIDFLRTPTLRGIPFHPGVHVPPGEAAPLRFPLAVTGAYLMVRTDLFQAVGGFDVQFSKECQDVDLCLRAVQLGWNVALTTSGFVHLENATRPKGDEDWSDRRLFLRRWLSFLSSVGLGD